MSCGMVTRSRSKKIFEYMNVTEEVKERLSSQEAARCNCGREFKTTRGLNVHRSRSKCGAAKPIEQRAEKSGETEEDQGQESHHSAMDPQAEEESMPRQPNEDERRERIKWPPLSNARAWEDLDEELDKVLEATLKGSAERKAEALTTVTYSLCAERFGTEERKEKRYEPSRRRRRMEQIRRELKSLRRR